MTAKKIVAITLFTNLSLFSIVVAMLMLAGSAGASTASQPSSTAPAWCGILTPADFVPVTHRVQYRNNGQDITPRRDEIRFVAAVDLPDADTVTKLLFAGVDDSNQSMDVTLRRITLSDGSVVDVATVASDVNSAAFDTWETTTISNGGTDLSAYDFYIFLQFHDEDELTFYYAQVFC